MRRPRQPLPEVHNNQDRWLLTYADMITLLTVFFLMLYSMSVMSKGKFAQLAVSVRGGFSGASNGGGKLVPNSGTTADRLGLSARESISYATAMRNLTQFVEQHNLAGTVSTRSDERGVVISLISDNMLFERGKSDVRPESVAVLDHISDILKSNRSKVAIEGHTCDLPIHTAQFPSNWELSTARAGTLLRYFTGRQNLPAGRFMVAGYADTKPLVPNSSEQNRARNRRVDIVIMKSEARRAVDIALNAEIRRITVDAGADAADKSDSSDPPDRANGANSPAGQGGTSAENTNSAPGGTDNR
jgi:chemotaxis protein MotB